MKLKDLSLVSIQGLLLSFLVNSHLALAQSQNEIELYAVDYPPYMIIDQSGNISGIDVEVTQSAFAAVDVPVKIVTAPWKRIEKSLQFGYFAGALSCSQRAGRDEFIFFSEPISEVNQVAVFKANADTNALNEFSDLRNFKVTVVDGWGIQKELAKKQIPHETTQAINNGLKAVVFRDVDIFYNGELTTLYSARLMNLQDKIKTKRFADKEGVSLHLCLSKKYSGNEELRDKFNQGLEKIKASGEYDKIYSKYL